MSFLAWKNFLAICVSAILFFSMSTSHSHSVDQNKLNSQNQQLAAKFAHYFGDKDVNGIGTLLNNDFALYEPGKVTKGKEAVINLLKEQFANADESSYHILRMYEHNNTTIMEFKISFNHIIYNGVDIIEWKNHKMSELRCYFNPPNKLTT